MISNGAYGCRGPLDDYLIGISVSAADKCSVNVEMENPESCEEQAGRLSTVGKIVPFSLLRPPKINFFFFFRERPPGTFGACDPWLE